VARAAEQLTLVLVPKNRQRSGVQESDAPFRIDHVKRVRDGRDRGKQRARIGKFPEWRLGHTVILARARWSAKAESRP